jgi:hypothetical protein
LVWLVMIAAWGDCAALTSCETRLTTSSTEPPADAELALLLVILTAPLEVVIALSFARAAARVHR